MKDSALRSIGLTLLSKMGDFLCFGDGEIEFVKNGRRKSVSSSGSGRHDGRMSQKGVECVCGS